MRNKKTKIPTSNYRSWENHPKAIQVYTGQSLVAKELKKKLLSIDSKYEMDTKYPNWKTVLEIRDQYPQIFRRLSGFEDEWDVKSNLDFQMLKTEFQEEFQFFKDKNQGDLSRLAKFDEKFLFNERSSKHLSLPVYVCFDNPFFPKVVEYNRFSRKDEQQEIIHLGSSSNLINKRIPSFVRHKWYTRFTKLKNLPDPVSVNIGGYLQIASKLVNPDLDPVESLNLDFLFEFSEFNRAAGELFVKESLFTLFDDTHVKSIWGDHLPFKASSGILISIETFLLIALNVDLICHFAIFCFN